MGFYRYQIPPLPYVYKWREETEPPPASNAVILIYAHDPNSMYFRLSGDVWDTIVPQPSWIVTVGA